MGKRADVGAMIDARSHAQALVGKEIKTLTHGQTNRILRLQADHVIVATSKSPSGAAVPIDWLQNAIDLLVRDGAVTVDVETLGYRSAFIGAFLATLPGTVVRPTTPRRVALERRTA